MRLVAGCGLMLVVLAVGGCGTSDAEMGEIVYKLPKISATEKPYQLPEIEGPKVEKKTPRPPIAMPGHARQ